MFTSHDAVIADRLATQRLTSVGHASTVDVVRDLVCVQSQDAPLARYSIGLRLREAIEDDVRQQLTTTRSSALIFCARPGTMSRATTYAGFWRSRRHESSPR